MPCWKGERAGRGRACTALGVLAFASALAHSAAASPELQALGEASVGVSDNVTAAPDDPLPNEASKIAGAFVVLRPGLVLGFASRRSLQQFTYTFDYDLFFARATSTSTANRLEYRGFFDISPSVNALIGAAATESDSYAALTLAPPASGLLPLLPAGRSRVLDLSADEGVSFDVSPGVRTFEAVGVRAGTPLFGGDVPKTLVPSAKLGAEYAWTADALGAEARGAYATVWNAVRRDGSRLRRARELTLGGVATYRHDLGRFFTSGLEGGAFRVTRLESNESRWYPTAAARLDYADINGSAELSYAHSLATSVLLGQTLLSDEVRLRGALPLDKSGEFSLAASSGYQRGRLLDEDARLATRLSVLMLDVTLGWQLQPWLMVGVRGQHLDQRSGARVSGLPGSFVQNTVLLGAALRFPPDREMAARYRAPQRVDRGDAVRGASEPVSDQIATPTGRAR